MRDIKAESYIVSLDNYARSATGSIWVISRSENQEW